MTNARVGTHIALLCLLSLASACGSSGGGGGAALACAQDGTCPQGFTCSNALCLFADAGSAQDASPVDTAAVDTAPVDIAAGDAAGAVDVGSVPDMGGGPVDTGATQDIAVAKDAGPTDAGPAKDAGGALPQKIVSLQGGTTSVQCANPSGSATVQKNMLVEDAVATTKAVQLSGKHGMFYIRPLASPPVDGKFAGIKVVVFDSVPEIAAGDVVRVSGDLVEYYCESEITVSDAPQGVAVVGKQAPPQAWKVGLQEIAWNNVASETYEGVLVRIEAAVVVASDILGTDGKPHGLFGVGPAGGAPGAGPMVQVGGSGETTFTVHDPNTARTTTKFSVGQTFKSITGHLTYSFGAYVLRVQTDADLVAQ